MLSIDESVSKHFTEGGDDRLHLKESGLNKYYVSPQPPAADVVARSSCTCSPPTAAGFDAAKSVLESLRDGKVTFDDAMRDIEARLKRVLNLNDFYEIVMHPSGSDAELIPLALATRRAERLECDAVVNIVVAAGEVGTGSAPAAGGRHFSKFVPNGSIVDSNEHVAAFFENTEVVELKPRCEDGTRNDNYDVLVRDAVAKAHTKYSKPFVVLHAVDGSKTGLRLPSRSVITELLDQHGDRILLCLDACQARSESSELSWFLERGACVLVTASKFFSAPGFCGAVVLSKDSSIELDSWGKLPAGLEVYLNCFDIPKSMPKMRSKLPAWEGTGNLGLLLRWAAGIREMELFMELGTPGKHAIKSWVLGVRELISKRRPKLELIDESYLSDVGDDTRIGGVNSVISFKVLTSCGSRFLDATSLKKIHRLLTIDSSSLLPEAATASERACCRRTCMIGQPVNLGGFGVLRLAAGAPMVRDLVETGIDSALKDDLVCIDKIIVLAKYSDSM